MLDPRIAGGPTRFVTGAVNAPSESGIASSADRSVRLLSRGTQNSSASALMTQSAPYSVHARRAIPVTTRVLLLADGPGRGGAPDAQVGVALEDLGRSVDRTVVGRDDQVGALGEVVLDHRGDDVDLVADHQRADDRQPPGIAGRIVRERSTASQSTAPVGVHERSICAASSCEHDELLTS